MSAARGLAALGCAAALLATTGWGAALPAAAQGMRVVIDPGHGGSDPGAVSTLLAQPEKAVALRLGLLVGAALERRGVGVVYTRSDDRDVALEQRASLPARAGAQALLSLHLNAAPNAGASGAEAWYGEAAGGQELAGAVLGALAGPLREAGSPVRGLRAGPNLAVLRGSAPAALLELGYISNADDARLLGQDRYLVAAAEATAEGVARFARTRPAAAAARATVSSGPSRTLPLAWPQVYFAQAGDTLAAVAARAGVPLDQLRALNAAVAAGALQVGQPVQVRGSGADGAERGAQQPGHAPQPAAPVLVASYRTRASLAPAAPAAPKAPAGTVASRASGPNNAPSVAPLAKPTADAHVMRPGETLGEVAQRYGVGAADLAQWNGVADPHWVQAGKRLRLAPPPPPPGAAYAVRTGDTLSALAREWGVTAEAIRRRNGLTEDRPLLAGVTITRP
ncbi:MAG: CBM50 [uncultured Chloroflexi bacterium]|uniref:CBM50 n=1 Tax=uncultured Chloroflexota bacterium TaxID=166587 RepID=A0A6J4IK19_9CHLR|nr:MAG: CBM50 [uncultured Chloroflexota bacterium]